MTEYWAEHAWLGGAGAVAGVSIGVDRGVIVSVEEGTTPTPDAVKLSGLTLPGLVNAHSHAFHRLLRGRTHDGSGSFWTWRDAMYRVAASLDPDRYFLVARAVFGEMIEAGFTAVGEFHYLHHGPGGERYGDPNRMGAAVVAAAEEAGIRLTLLDACYLHGGFDDTGPGELDPVQERFSDGSVDGWIERVEALRDGDRHRIGVAAHSVRAVDPVSLAAIGAWVGDRVVHAHVSEQPAENQQASAAYGATPTALLGSAGLLGERFTAVHATHLEPSDFELLASSAVCLCPTTEQDLADGIGPSMGLSAAGTSLCIGTDSHARIDPFEEMRTVEMHARLESGRRGNHAPADVAAMASEHGYRSIGWPEGGRIAVGAVADLTVVGLDSVRLAGASEPLAAVTFGAASSDVSTVIVGGEVVVSDGRHVSLDVARELARVTGFATEDSGR